jgi:hypothetical protein
MWLEVGGTLIGGGRACGNGWRGIVEWYQIHQAHGFHVLEDIPFAPFQTLL